MGNRNNKVPNKIFSKWATATIDETMDRKLKQNIPTLESAQILEKVP